MMDSEKLEVCLGKFTKNCKEKTKSFEMIENFDNLAHFMSREVVKCISDDKNEEEKEEKQRDNTNPLENALKSIFSRTTMSDMEDVDIIVQHFKKLVDKQRDLENESKKNVERTKEEYDKVCKGFLWFEEHYYSGFDEITRWRENYIEESLALEFKEDPVKSKIKGIEYWILCDVYNKSRQFDGLRNILGPILFKSEYIHKEIASRQHVFGFYIKK